MLRRDYVRTLFRLKAGEEPLTRRQAIQSSIIWSFILATNVAVYLDVKPILDADAALKGPAIISQQAAMNMRIVADLTVDETCSSQMQPDSAKPKSEAARQCVLAGLNRATTTVGAVYFVRLARPWLIPGAVDPEVGAAAHKAIGTGWLDIARNESVYDAQDAHSAALAKSFIGRLFYAYCPSEPMASTWGKMLDNAEYYAFAGEVSDRQNMRRLKRLKEAALIR